MTEKNRVVDVVTFTDAALEGTEEFALGLREIRKRLLTVRRWHMMSGNTIPAADFPAWSDASWVLVILNPAILISDNLLDELVAVTDNGTVCALPADPRGFTSGVGLDYASRPGFDRFVARLEVGARKGDYDNREPWIYLVECKALMELGASQMELSWSAVPSLLEARAAIAHHAFVHSYADYHSHTRSEMLRLLPINTRTLLDVGGGDGNFARTFMAERGGHATLLEANPRIAEAARERGMDVIVGDFESATVTEMFDCIAMLDVLEHMPDPLAALVHARRFLKPGGALLLSLPNVGHWSVVWDLLEGKFDYQPAGILCNTHLRFFTRHGLQTLLGDAGFQVERWENSASPAPLPFVTFLERAANSTPSGEMPTRQDVVLDSESLTTDSFHVLARLA